jgi:hypothetical protein
MLKKKMRMTVMGVVYKECGECRTLRRLDTDFQKNVSASDGRQCRCRKCQNECMRTTHEKKKGRMVVVNRLIGEIRDIKKEITQVKQMKSEMNAVLNEKRILEVRKRSELIQAAGRNIYVKST